MNSLLAVVQKENARLTQENSELRTQNRNLREFINFLHQIARMRVESDNDLLPVLEAIFHKALWILDAPDGSLLLLDEDSQELAFVIVRGELAESLRGHRIPATEGIAGWVIQHRQPTLVRDVRRDPRFSNRIDQEFSFRTQSIAAAPLIGNGKLLGVIEALNQPGDQPFSDEDVALLELLCRFAGEALADVEPFQGEAL
jgi:phosphoserine phosphatase RsbU/P